MSNEWVPPLLGAVAGVVTSLGTSVFQRRRTAAEVQQALAEAEKARAEAEKARAEARAIDARIGDAVRVGEEQREELGTRVADTEAAIAYERVTSTPTTIYSSEVGGFSLFHFETEQLEGGSGELAVQRLLRPSDTLVIRRHNDRGRIFVWLKRYGFAGSPDVIPGNDRLGLQRNIRVTCRIRAVDAEHTVLLVLKQLGSPPGTYLGYRRFRLQSADWATLDATFNVVPTGDVRLRIEDRSVSAAPTRLELFDLEIFERAVPATIQQT